MNDEELIEFGKEYALNSPIKFKHAALIVKGERDNRRIVAKGYNRYIPDLMNHDHSIHAEIAALEDFMDNRVNIRLPKQKRISQAKTIMKKSTYYMFVIRLGKQKISKTGYSKPCHKCQSEIEHWNIREIYYTT